MTMCCIDLNCFVMGSYGHRETVYGVAWSPRNEFILASARHVPTDHNSMSEAYCRRWFYSADRSIRIWDVRAAGSSSCLMSLNQHALDYFGQGHLSQFAMEVTKRHDRFGNRNRP